MDIVVGSSLTTDGADGKDEMANFCRFHPDDLDASGLTVGRQVQLIGEHHRATLPVEADPGVVRGCVRIFLGSAKTSAFGADTTVTVQSVAEYD